MREYTTTKTVYAELTESGDYLVDDDGHKKVVPKDIFNSVYTPESCTRQIGPMMCGEDVSVVLTGEHDTLRMCASCADAIKDTSGYSREDLKQ